MAQKQVRIFVAGLGVLGEALARTLGIEGADVIAADLDEAAVSRVKDYVQVAAVADVTDAEALRQLGAATCDIAVVCIGEDLEAEVLATTNLLELGCPRVTARANSRLAETILRRLGAHEVFFVESTVGEVMARRLVKSSRFSEMDIGDGLLVVQWEPPKRFQGRTLRELELPARHKAQVIGIRRKAQGFVISIPEANSIVEPGDLLLVAGLAHDLERLLAVE